MRRLRIVKRSVTILLSVALVLGVTYEQLGRMRDRKRLPQIGRSVDIAGRTLNIFCSGTGGPAVVFESGGDGPGLEWEPVQTQVANFTQACWYDRAGIGWSDPGPFPRTSEAIAGDLHALLHRAGVPAPTSSGSSTNRAGVRSRIQRAACWRRARSSAWPTTRC